MKKKIILALCVALLTACSHHGYEIEGTVDLTSLNEKYVYLHAYGAPEAPPLDSVKVENGKFRMAGTAHMPRLFVLEFNADDVERQLPKIGQDAPYTAVFILENAKLQVVLTVSGSTVSGTPENEVFFALKTALPAYSDNEEKLADAATQYIMQHPGWLSSTKVLHDFRYLLDEDFRRRALQDGGDLFRAAPYMDRMADHLTILEKVGVGKVFTDIELNNPEGNPVKLSDYAGRGKIVLVDFWASWCPPCRADIPHLVQLYAENKDKGFEIVGVSLDRNREDWVKGIQDLGITWPQMSDLKFWQSKGAALYGVNRIPHTVLIDEGGRILAKNLKGEELERILSQILH
jgi:thiol-disulfide isomerase/thioredoxin